MLHSGTKFIIANGMSYLVRSPKHGLELTGREIIPLTSDGTFTGKFFLPLKEKILSCKSTILRCGTKFIIANRMSYLVGNPCFESYHICYETGNEKKLKPSLLSIPFSCFVSYNSGIPVAQWVKRCLTVLAVPSSIPA